MNPDNGSDGLPGDHAERLFRREGFVTDTDLRVDVANEMVHHVAREEDVRLDEKLIHARNAYHVGRGARERTVEGSYERTVDGTDAFSGMVSVEETVTGGVDQRANVENQAIIGGAYAYTVVGPHLRLAAWSDFLVWGGWAEADLARVEISNVAIRSYMAYAHKAKVRVVVAANLCDDWVQRNEQFGSLHDTTASEMNMGTPGSGVDMHV